MLHDYRGDRLKALRKRAMLTQAQVVQLTGVSLATLYNAEKGARRPQTRTLDKLLGLYAMQIKYWKNVNQTFEETHAGNLSAQTALRTGSTRLNAGGAAQKT